MRYGGWRAGDPVAARRFAELGHLPLESGTELPGLTVAYETAGTPRLEAGRIANAVLVEHALTGDAHVTGPAGPGQPTAGWWDALVGPGRALDTDRWYVVSSNVLGGCQGTTGPSSLMPFSSSSSGRPWGSRFPVVTIRDQVEVERRLADALKIERWAAVVGGSMGGMRALEWAVSWPGRVGAALVLATGAAVTADQIGLQSAQILAVTSDPAWQGGDYLAAGSFPAVGLGLARRLAHLSYRSERELDERFGRQRQPGRGDLYAVQSYLDHQAGKLVGRFDAGSYVTLTEAMNSHDVGRGRGGVAAALRGVGVPVVVAGIDSDRLYPLRLQQELAELIPTCPSLDVLPSRFGHDGFLLEAEAVGALVRRTLALDSS
ncbi:homoserine O-acetyltransferase [uncultured Friedmanniella sp.]|uniref:homoserine O-acetyltransferase MetX n=1 Tax=uncultured Friedmanniella sp. TaxID=335381 RepID=UPI0035CA7C5D